MYTIEFYGICAIARAYRWSKILKRPITFTATSDALQATLTLPKSIERAKS